MQELEKILTDQEPDDALEQLLPLARQLLSHLDDEARRAWFTRLLEGDDRDKLAGMVNL
ncbi:hypothetical protein P0N66_02280 [Desulfurivibrio alkaliphilus]|nr:hypothetical protein [Desulfurivibrio alkaliphilus]MDF1613779.1 hypothetical protein [Desulfurivibrio alkaliphilus]